MLLATNSGMKLFDERLNEIVQNGTEVIIKDAKWNPFVPYWIASSTTDRITIHDIRFSLKKPMRSYTQSLLGCCEWSNANCDLFCSTGSDKTVSLYSIASESKPLDTIPHSNSGGALTKCISCVLLIYSIVFSSRAEMNVFYGISMLGKIVRVDVDPEYLWSHAPVTDALHDSVERALYCRNFDQVQQAITDLYNSNQQPNNEDEIKKLEELSRRVFPVEGEPNEWKIDTLKDIDFFEEELNERRLSCPIQFELSSFVSRDIQLKNNIDILRLKVKIRKLLRDQKIDELLLLLGNVEMNCFVEIVSPNILFDLISLVYKIDGSGRQAALDLAVKYLPFYGGRLDQEGCRVVYLLLFPTVFDSQVLGFLTNFPDSASQATSPIEFPASAGIIDKKMKDLTLFPFSPPIPKPEPNFKLPHPTDNFRLNAPSIVKSLEVSEEAKRSLQNTKIAVDMLSVENELAQCTEMVDKEALSFRIHSKEQRVSISAEYSWSLILSLLGRGLLDDYFMHLQTLQKLFPTAPYLSKALCIHRDTIGLAKLKYVLSQALDNPRPTMLLRCLLTVCKLAQFYSQSGTVMPQCMDMVMVDKLRRLQRVLKLAECTRFGGFGELKDCLTQINPKEKLWRGVISAELLKEIGLLKSRLF